MTDEAPSKPPKLVGAVTQSFRILRTLSQSREPLGVTALARKAGVNPSTAFNILRTLVAEDAVAFDALSKTYVLGSGLLKIFGPSLNRHLIEDIKSELQSIADESSCLVGLWESSDGKMVLTDRAVSNMPMRLDMQVHQRLPAFAGAVGRAFAARMEMSDAKLAAGFEQLRWAGKIDAATYISEVREAEENGYAIDDEALHPGVVTVASVISDEDGNVTHGLTASDIAHRLDRDRLHEVGRRLEELARKISR